MEEIRAKLRAAQAELKTAGPIHARDLRKHIHRLRVQLLKYKEERK